MNRFYHDLTIKQKYICLIYKLTLRAFKQEFNLLFQNTDLKRLKSLNINLAKAEMLFD